jgi:hypothetical protein
LHLSNQANNFFVAAAFGDRERARVVPMTRMLTHVGIAAVFEQKADHLYVTCGYRIMERAVVDRREIHIDQLRPQPKHASDAIDFSCPDRSFECCGCHSVNVRLQFRPTLKSISARQDDLRIVQRECLAICAFKMRSNFGGRGGISRAERFDQLFSLTLKLIQIGMLAHDASRGGLLHNELLSWRPVPAVSG